MPASAYKRCSQCGETKPLTAYYRRARSPDGLAYKCKECSTAYAARWRAQNIETMRAYDRQRYLKDRDSGKRTAYRIANRDHIRRQKREAYRRSHPNVRTQVVWQLRFLRYVGDQDERGCIGWKGAVTPRTEYGAFERDGKAFGAHRIAHELIHGPIDSGLHLHHICENRGCINPKHLEALTPAEHRRRHG